MLGDMRGPFAAFISSLVSMVAFVAACGGTATPAEEPEESVYDDSSDVEQPDLARGETSEQEEGQEPAREKSADVPAPEFKEGMSVNEAISAVPQGTERVNLDQDELAEPLKDSKVYEPCKPAANAHWTVRVAIWEGRAVGIDIKTTPANARLSECITTQVKAITWRDKVPSLNTVEYSF
jgi:hypothetical protein